jgi:hypothetical protein
MSAFLLFTFYFLLLPCSVNGICLTRNWKNFEKARNLSLEDWTWCLSSFFYAAYG